MVVTLISVLVGCGVSDNGDTGGVASAPSIARTMAKELGPQATDVVVITEDNDSNNLLGRPNGYSSAAVINDADLPDQTDPGVGSGATIEVWKDGTAAQARADYIQGLLAASPILGSEYDYVEGPILLRVNGDIKPTVAAKYEAAFKSTTSG